MPKVSIIGAGNVGATTAMRLLEEGIAEIILVDIAKGLGMAKAFDMKDSLPLLKRAGSIAGSDDIADVSGSDIVVVTAGLARRPGMTREELLQKNAEILKEIALKIKAYAPGSIVIVVTNPLDIMTYLALRLTGFDSKRLFGMGVSLDAARFINLISEELNVPNTDIEAQVLGAHGEAMLILPRLTTIKGVSLEKFMDAAKIEELAKRAKSRGAEIVGLLGSGSAYYAPSAAIEAIVKAIIKDEKRIIGVCAYLNGEYGVKDVCMGVPCRIGKNGIEQVIELELNEAEKKAFQDSCVAVRRNIEIVKDYIT